MELTKEEVLRRAGGAKKVSDYLETKGIFISPSGVSRWPGRKEGFPVKYWPYIIELTKGLAPLTPEDMLSLHSQPVEDGEP